MQVECFGSAKDWDGVFYHQESLPQTHITFKPARTRRSEVQRAVYSGGSWKTVVVSMFSASHREVVDLPL